MESFRASRYMSRHLSSTGLLTIRSLHVHDLHGSAKIEQSKSGTLLMSGMWWTVTLLSFLVFLFHSVDQAKELDASAKRALFARKPAPTPACPRSLRSLFFARA